MDTLIEPRRGPGRPPGSLNRPKLPLMSAAERKKVKRDLGTQYRGVIADRAIAEARAKGMRDLIVAKLGREGLAEIQAEMIVEHEVAATALPKVPAPPQLQPRGLNLARTKFAAL